TVGAELYRRVVYEPRRAASGRDHQQRLALVAIVHTGEHDGVNQFQVVEHGARGGEPRVGPGSGRLSPGREPAGQRLRRRTLIGREVRVPAGDGQPVRIPHDRDTRDLHAEVQVRGHLADERELLRVLLAEDRHIRTDYFEELQHDGQHAGEEAGPRAALQKPPDRAGVDADQRLRRVHLVWR